VRAEPGPNARGAVGRGHRPEGGRDAGGPREGRANAKRASGRWSTGPPRSAREPASDARRRSSTRLSGGAQSNQVDRPAPAARARVLALAALAALGTSYLVAVVLTAITLLTAGGLPGAGALLVDALPVWLAAHQVPIVLSGAPLGVLPLAPTLLLIAATGPLAASATRRLGGRIREDAVAVVAVLAGVHASMGVLATAVPENQAQAAPWAALLGTGTVAGIGATLGALRVTGPPRPLLAAPDWLRIGARAGVTGAAALAVVAAGVLAAGFVRGALSPQTQVAVDPSFATQAGLVLLSLYYLPNALVASVAWLAGPGFSIGAAAASPLFVVRGPIPPVPLAIAMPLDSPPAWASSAFIVPLAVGLLVGKRCRSFHDDSSRRLRAVAVAAAGIALTAALLAELVTGRLAGGQFGPVTVPAAAVGGALLGWIAAAATLVALLPPRDRRNGTVRDAVTRSTAEGEGHAAFGPDAPVAPAVHRSGPGGSTKPARSTKRRADGGSARSTSPSDASLADLREDYDNEYDELDDDGNLVRREE